MNSLGGQNSHRRMSGARSSRASSTIFHRLRKLDRAIGLIDLELSIYKKWSFGIPSYFLKILKRREKLDEKRKLIRQQRKKL